MEVIAKGGFKRVMLPIDFSAHCTQAAAYAVWFARMSSGVVHLVHVVTNAADDLYEPEEVPHWVLVEHAQKRAGELLRTLADQCLPPRCRREYHVLVGDAFEKLVEAGKRIGPDVIVMATHGRSGMAHLVIGSVTEKIVRHASCPVFVVRREKKEKGKK